MIQKQYYNRFFIRIDNEPFFYNSLNGNVHLFYVISVITYPIGE